MGEIQPSTQQNEPAPPPVTSPQAIPMAPEIEQFALQVQQRHFINIFTHINTHVMYEYLRVGRDTLQKLGL